MTWILPGTGPSLPERVYDIQNAIRESDHHLCFEVSRLKTEFYKKHGFKKPTHIHRAERLAHVLKNKKVIIYPEELLVGNFTSKRKGGQVWEEHYGILFLSIIHQINRQTPVSFKCSFRDKLNFYFKIFPFWMRHSLLAKVNKSLSDLILMIARCSEMNTGFNNNMAAIAHFIVNFERMLELGTTGIIEEIRAMQKEKPGNNQDFYNGAIIALEGLENVRGTLFRQPAGVEREGNRSRPGGRSWRRWPRSAGMSRSIPRARIMKRSRA